MAAAAEDDNDEEDEDEEDESSDPDIEEEIRASTQQDGPGENTRRPVMQLQSEHSKVTVENKHSGHGSVRNYQRGLLSLWIRTTPVLTRSHVRELTHQNPSFTRDQQRNLYG